MSTVYEKVTFTWRHDWRKHGPFSESSTEDDYVRYQFGRMPRGDLLEAISDAVEERIAEIKNEIMAEINAERANG